MTLLGPFALHAQIIERKPNFIDLMIRDTPGVTGYRLWASRTLNAAYGNLVGTTGASGVGGTGGTALFDVTAGQQFQSASIVQRGLRMEESTRGMTRIMFDLEDFIVPPGAGNPVEVPSDDETLYLRVQVSTQAFGGFVAVAGGAPQNAGLAYKGPTLVIPPAPFWGARRPSLTLAGLAPGNTGAAEGVSPVFDETLQDDNHPMHLILPRPTTSLIIKNTDTGGDFLFVALGGVGGAYTVISDGEQDAPFGSPREIILASNAASTNFGIVANINLGQN